MSEQKPTVGRIVHYYDDEEGGPHAAIITRVHSDDIVNLRMFTEDERGTALITSAVRYDSLYAAEEGSDSASCYWVWPPRA